MKTTHPKYEEPTRPLDSQGVGVKEERFNLENAHTCMNTWTQLVYILLKNVPGMRIKRTCMIVCHNIY